MNLPSRRIICGRLASEWRELKKLKGLYSQHIHTRYEAKIENLDKYGTSVLGVKKKKVKLRKGMGKSKSLEINPK